MTFFVTELIDPFDFNTHRFKIYLIQIMQFTPDDRSIDMGLPAKMIHTKSMKDMDRIDRIESKERKIDRMRIKRKDSEIILISP